MKKYKMQISYVILLTLCLPLSALYFTLFGETAAVAENADSASHLLSAYIPLGFVYWTGVTVLGIFNMIQSFRSFKAGSVSECVNGMLIHKYGLVVFFVNNFCTIALLMFSTGLIAMIASQGTIIFALPFLLPWLFAALIAASFFTWLAMIPGAFWGIQVIRFTRVQRGMSMGKAIFHGFLQFVFMADVLDAAYLSVKKWGRGKRSAAVICALYVLLVAGAVWSICRIFA